MEYLISLIINVLLLVFALAILIFVVYSLIGEILGAPFVPTYQRYINEILEKGDLKKGQRFIELGSGDGRVVRAAVKKYGVEGLGVEIHPLLVIYANLVSKVQNLPKIKFVRQNFFKVDLSDQDVIFLFLLPKTLKKLREKFLKECKDQALIISHGFKIEGFDKFLVFSIQRKLYSTYYYVMKTSKV